MNNNNPYAPPEANIVSEMTFKRSIWWKVYFYPITLLFFIGMISILKEESAGFVDYLYMATTIVATIGFWGFIYQKKILFPRFWIVFLVLYIVFGVAYEFITEVDFRDGMSDKHYYISILIGYVLSFPSYVAIFSYGKNNNPVWKKTIDQHFKISSKVRRIFWASYICGVITYISTAVYLRYIYLLNENMLLSHKHIFILLVVFSIISTAISSYHYNKDIAFPLYHPIAMFFRLLLSKSTLIPSLFFPLGVYSGNVLFSLVSQKEIWESIFIFGSKVICLLYIISTLGSFVGIFISNRRLSPSL